MAKKQIGSSNRGRKSIPLLKSEIEEAQRNTNSNRQAAKWLGVSDSRYKRYAKIYNLYDQHSNPLGLGTTKGFAKNPKSIPLRDIFTNKHTDYSMIRLKYRMVARNMLDEQCGLCGFSEKRLSDGKSPLMLTFKDTMGDFSRDNLHLLCYNCTFLTTGAPWVAHQKYLETSLLDPERAKKHKDDIPKQTDSMDPVEDAELETSDAGHTSDLRSLQEEILRELGR
jgi:hypothetical protein